MADFKKVLRLDIPFLTAPAQVELDDTNIRACYSADLSWFNTVLIVTRSWQEVPNEWGSAMGVKAINVAWHNELSWVMGRTLYPVFPTDIVRGYSSANDHLRPEFYGMALQQMAAEKDRFNPDAMFVDMRIMGQSNALPVAGRDLNVSERAEVYDAVTKAATYLPPTFAGTDCWSAYEFGISWYLSPLYQGGATGETTFYVREPEDLPSLAHPPQIADRNLLVDYLTVKVSRVGHQDDGGGNIALLSSEAMALDLVGFQQVLPNLKGVIIHIDRTDFANVLGEWGSS